MDRTTLILTLRSESEAAIKVAPISKRCPLFNWTVAGGPYWATVEICKLLGDYGPPTMFSDHVEYRIHGGLHRLQGPALIWNDEYKQWRKNNLVHRDGDLPAIISSGVQHWFKHGRHHRDGNLPASIWSHGRKEWWINDVFVRKEDS